MTCGESGSLEINLWYQQVEEEAKALADQANGVIAFVKIDEAHLHNNGFWDYPCFDQFENIMDHCGSDLFEPMFEMYKVRLMSGTQKPQGYNRL